MRLDDAGFGCVEAIEFDEPEQRCDAVLQVPGNEPQGEIVSTVEHGGEQWALLSK